MDAAVKTERASRPLSEWTVLSRKRRKKMKGMSAFSAIQTILLGGKKSFLSEQSVPDTLRANTRKIVLNVYKCTRKKGSNIYQGINPWGLTRRRNFIFNTKRDETGGFFFPFKKNFGGFTARVLYLLNGICKCWLRVLEKGFSCGKDIDRAYIYINIWVYAEGLAATTREKCVA